MSIATAEQTNGALTAMARLSNLVWEISDFFFEALRLCYKQELKMISMVMMIGLVNI